MAMAEDDAFGPTLPDVDPTAPTVEGPTPADHPQVEFPVPNWDRYEFISLLGRGGMGAVFKARDRRLGREVALKFILGGDPRLFHRFMQEARAQASIDHDNICKVFETGEVEGKPYIAMELVHGSPLDKASRAMSLNEKVQVIADTALALDAAHQMGIIHRDIKPSNIMVEQSVRPDGTAKYRPIVMDFGLARETNAGKGLTESGAVMGTPQYMSPEQARGDVRKLDRRSDVYSLGATLYELLTGEAPFVDENLLEIIFKVLSEDIKPPRKINPAIPEALDTIVCKSLNKEPEQRYQTARAMADDLVRLLSAGRVVAKRLSLGYRIRYWARRKPAIAALTVALSLSIGGLLGYGVYTQVENARKEREAQHEAELARRLGQTIKDLEWRMRTDYLLPIHDTDEEKKLVREQMAQIDEEVRSAGAHGARLAHYALGRGHLSLHEWAKAQEHLEQAEKLGLSDPELDYALGRVLGERYNIALEEARRSGDKTFLEKRKKELEKEFLEPARKHLERSRALKTVASAYVDALLDFYNQRYDGALSNAKLAQKQQRNLYEASKLEGDVYLTRGLDQKDRGEYEAADKSLQEAIKSYERAANAGRSDATVHEALAEAYIRAEQIDSERGRDPEPWMQKALRAADDALACAPKDSRGFTRKAYAYCFAAIAAAERGDIEKAKQFHAQQIATGTSAIALNPDDAYAFEMLGVAHEYLATMSIDAGQIANAEDIERAVKYFAKAIELNPSFTWAYNDFANTLYQQTRTLPYTSSTIEKNLNRAIELSTASLGIDANQASVHSSLVLYHYALANWEIERGGDPSAAFAQANVHAEKALKLNPELFLIHGNLGKNDIALASYLADKGEDGRDVAQRAVDHFQELLRINDKIALAYADLADAFRWRIRHAIAQKQTPSDALSAGHDTITRCYSVDANNLSCKMQEARLLAAEADSLPRTDSKRAQLVIEQALASIGKVLEQCPKDRDCLLPFAEIALQALESEGFAKTARNDAFSRSISATGILLEQSPGWPRIMALRAALLWRGLDEAQNDSARKERVAQAVDLFQKAFAGNALLKHRYGDMAEKARLERSP